MYENQKSNKFWKIGLVFLAVLNIVFVPLLALTSLFGSLVYALVLVFIPLLIPTFIFPDSWQLIGSGVLILNLIVLPIYLLRRKPDSRVVVIAMITLSVVVLVLQGIFALDKREDDGVLGLFGLTPGTSTGNKDPDEFKNISKQEAIELLRTCKIKSLNYNNQNHAQNGMGGELSPTGIELTMDTYSKQPYGLSISDKLIPVILPIAQESQKTCTELKIWQER